MDEMTEVDGEMPGYAAVWGRGRPRSDTWSERHVGETGNVETRGMECVGWARSGEKGVRIGGRAEIGLLLIHPSRICSEDVEV
jgi:hypothetical protein